MLSSSSGRGRLDLKRRPPPFWLLLPTTVAALALVSSDPAALPRCATRRWEMTPPPPPPLLLLARAAMRDADWTMALMVIAIVIVLDRLSLLLLSLVMVGRGCCCVSLLFYVWCRKLLEEDGVRHFVVLHSDGQTDIVSLVIVILRFRDRFGCKIHYLILCGDRRECKTMQDRIFFQRLFLPRGTSIILLL